jgi:hypothetical protein
MAHLISGINLGFLALQLLQEETLGEVRIPLSSVERRIDGRPVPSRCVPSKCFEIPLFVSFLFCFCIGLLYLGFFCAQVTFFFFFLYPGGMCLKKRVAKDY